MVQLMLLSDCDVNDLCLARTISWSPGTQWVNTKDLPTFINGTCKSDCRIYVKLLYIVNQPFI